MNPSDNKMTEQDLTDLVRDQGKALPDQFEERVWAKIKKREIERERLKKLSGQQEPSSDPEFEK